MPNEIKAKTMAEIPMQKASQDRSPAEARGRYFNSANAFNLILPPVPDAVFTEEPAVVLAADASTGYTTCDLAGDMQNPTPATTPLLLARYARLNAGETLNADFDTAGSIWYVIKGEGAVVLDNQEIAWAAGDVFVLPGGAAALKGGIQDSVLWLVTNEPQLRFEDTRAPAASESSVDVVHFPGRRDW